VLPHEALLEIDTRPEEEPLVVDQVRYRVEEALVEALNQPMPEIVASALYPFISWEMERRVETSGSIMLRTHLSMCSGLSRPSHEKLSD
jgi:hypothetical protein